MEKPEEILEIEKDLNSRINLGAGWKISVLSNRPKTGLRIAIRGPYDEEKNRLIKSAGFKWKTGYWAGDMKAVEILEQSTSANNADEAMLEASASGDLDALKNADADGADIDATNKNGETALIIAAKNSHYDIVEYLWSAGADTKHVDSNGKSAADYLRDRAANSEIIKKLEES